MLGEATVELVTLGCRDGNLFRLRRDLVPQVLHELQTLVRRKLVEVYDAIHLASIRLAPRTRQATAVGPPRCASLLRGPRASPNDPHGDRGRIESAGIDRG